MTDSTTSELFPSPPPPALPVATPDERAELLVKLRVDRHQLINAYAIALALGEQLSASAVQPLATVQAAIMAVEADFEEGGP